LARPPGRLFYIDSLRACLMLAGVFFHAALVYGAETAFVVRDPSRLNALDHLASLLSSFRMPAFFVLAGMFWTLVSNRGPLREALSARLRLVLLPFLTLAITVQPLQHALLLWHQGRLDDVDLGSFVGTFFQPGELSDNTLFGRPVVGHLWFLLTLVLFYLLAAGVQHVLEARRSALASALVDVALRHKWLWALAAGLGVAAVRALLARVWIAPDWSYVLVYVPYFAAGALAFRRPGRFEAFLGFGALDAAALMATTLVLFVPELRQRLPGLLLLPAQVGFALEVTVVLLRLFRRHWDRPSAWQRRLVDASYTVYLFHYAVVLTLGIALMGVAGMPSLLKYLLVVACAMGLPLALHVGLVARVPLLRWLVNGRTPPKAAAGAASVSGPRVRAATAGGG
jgi:glucan biosynthesis protein C